LSYSLIVYVLAHLGRRTKTEFGSCDKRRYSFTRHFSQHVVLRRHDVRYAVFKEQAPHQGPAVAKAADATLSERCVRSKLNSAISFDMWYFRAKLGCRADAQATTYRERLLNANRIAARILSLWGPDGRRDAISFVFDLVKTDRVSSRSSHLACRMPGLRSAYDI
jgi:hypothetical protein